MIDYNPKGRLIVVPLTALVPTDISSETVTIPAGAAGSLANFYLAKKPIVDSNKSWIGGADDTSLVLTSTAFDNEVAFGTSDANLSNGDYYIDYITGKGRGKKKDGSVSMTVDYSIFLSGLAAGGTINGSLILGNSLVATPDEITATDAGIASSVDTVTTKITTNGDSDLDNVTLANGVDGQIKVFSIVAVGNAADSVKITPANMIGGTQITFGASPLGLGCIMEYDSGEGGWVVVGNNGGVIA